MPDVRAAKVHQNNRSYICEVSGPTFGFTMQEFSMVGNHTENPEKLSKLGVSACLRQYGITIHEPHLPEKSRHNRPFMNVEHFYGKVQCEHICRVIDGGQPSILQVHIEGPGEVHIQQLT